MGDINKKDGQLTPLIPANASKMRFSEKRKSMNLIVQVDTNRYNRSDSASVYKTQPSHDTEENEQTT